MRTDDEPIRTLSTILYDTLCRPGFIHTRVSYTDALFIRIENTVGARSAQIRSSRATAFTTLYT